MTAPPRWIEKIRPQRWFLLVLVVAQLAAQYDQSTTVVPGCAKIHCDGRESNNARLMPPVSSGARIIAHDTIPTGSGNPGVPAMNPNQGAGCAANGHVVVCSYNNPFGDNVVAYNSSGARLWTSGNLLDSLAFASVPIITASGSVIAADDNHVIRFGPTGAVLWNTPTIGGIPISPVVTQSGVVVLATKNGPISAYDSADGHLIGSIYVSRGPGDSDYFDTTNTPCVVNDRLYVSMAIQNDPDNTAWLVAVDVDSTNQQQPLSVAWHYVFGGPSYASVGCGGDAVFFDGGRLNPGDPGSPQLFAVHDNGTSASLIWAQAMPSYVAGSVTPDPRGGFWMQIGGAPGIQRRDALTGALIESLNISKLVGDPIANIPYSVMTMTGTATRPILIEGTVNIGLLSSYVIAVDLTKQALLWKINLNPMWGNDNTLGQFPLVLDAKGKPVLVFSGRTTGAYFVSDP